ncbi:MAG: helix-turn-helix transcriptional regulator [Thermodesulfobacteriota bacterium]
MPRSVPRTYSRIAREAVLLLGQLIRAARTERKLSAQEVAERAGISRGLLRRIENGGMKCEIGAAFEVAVIVGVPLFDDDPKTPARHLRHTREKLALLPQSVRKERKPVDDDF